MRKSFFFAALFVISVCSCSREVVHDTVDGMFTATLEAVLDSKTSIVGNKVLWKEGDEINIFTESANELFTLSSGEGTITGGFIGNPMSGTEFFALYPYNETAYLKSGRIITSFPAEQVARTNNVTDSANLAVAYSTSSSLQFKNVGALIKFTISSENVGEVLISGNNGEIIAGTVSIDCNGGDPSYLMGTERYTQINVKPSVAGTAFPLGDYYAVVLPRNFSKGITVTYKPVQYFTDAVVKAAVTPSDIVQSGKSVLNLQRSHIRPIGDIAEDRLWTYQGVKINCLRDSGNNYGQYIDFNTGRTFSAVGGYAYSNVIDLAFVQWTGAGFCSMSSSYASSVTNSINLGKYGSFDSVNDLVSNWSTRNTTNLFYLSSMTSSDYSSITTVSQLKSLYETVSPVTQYLSSNNSEGKNLTNAKIIDGTQKYCIFKVNNLAEGTGYGLICFTDVNGATGDWYVTCDYKFGIVPGAFVPDVNPVHPVGSPLLINPYGICAHLTGSERTLAEDIVKDVKAMNVNWIRTDFNWSWINPSPGVWNYSFMNDNTGYAKDVGVNLLPILAYDVEWCRPVADYLDDWEDYVRRVVTRYSKYIRCWEVYNEPNHTSYWHGEAPNAERYTLLLKRTYEVIKSIDPELSVIAGGLAGVPLPYLETCLANGAADYCDAFNIHPYHITGKPETIAKDITNVNALLANYHCENKPLWITEVGWPAPPIIVDIGVSEETQAQYVPRTYIVAFANGLNRVFWFEYRSPEDAPDNYRNHYGLTHKDLSVRPSHLAYTTMVSQLPSGSTRPILSISGNIYLAHWQNPEGKDVWAYWSDNGARNAILDWTGTVDSAVNLLGSDVIPSKGNITVTPSCNYIIGPSSLTITSY